MSKLITPLEFDEPLEVEGVRVKSILTDTETDESIDVVLEDGRRVTVSIEYINNRAQGKG